jgi:MYXO-CTERM domain-containing protein
MTDNNVVAILINSSQGLSLCTGSLIAPNLVLTAHHCVATPPASLVCGRAFSATYASNEFVVTPSYDAAGQIFNSNNPSWPTADDVTWFAVSSIAVPGTDICGDDLAALTLSAPMAGICPLIPSVDTAPTDGEPYSAIGFGITSPNGQTAGTRYKAVGLSVQCVGAADCSDSTISATEEWEGGSTAQKGTCEGDSGGPALDSTGRVIGSTSRGPSNACNTTVYETYSAQSAWIKQVATTAATAGGYAAAGWVTGGATSDPANGYPCESAADAGSMDAGSMDAGSPDAGSAGGGDPQTCAEADQGVGCCAASGELFYCTVHNVLTGMTCGNGTVCGWNAAMGYYDCVPSPGGADPSGTYPMECAGPPADAGSPDAGSSDAGMGSHGFPDSGMPDAGAPDGGKEDAGPRDAGLEDAGTTDGMGDAGSHDAGVEDAGVELEDAGSHDAGGAREDAGAHDAGTRAEDAGSHDGGREDAGVEERDAGSKADAGETADSGMPEEVGTADAGAPSPTGHTTGAGCSCGATNAGEPSLLGIMILALVLRRRPRMSRIF